MQGTKITSQNILKGIAIIALLAGVFWYMLFQARNLLLGPEVVIVSPEETVQRERTITLAGTTKNIVSLTLNGRSIFTDEKGSFENMLVLEDGYTIMTLRAEDKYGRMVTLSKSFVYAPINDIN